jgi:hypothetical protein
MRQLHALMQASKSCARQLLCTSSIWLQAQCLVVPFVMMLCMRANLCDFFPFHVSILFLESASHCRRSFFLSSLSYIVLSEQRSLAFAKNVQWLTVSAQLKYFNPRRRVISFFISYSSSTPGIWYSLTNLSISGYRQTF